ncbi:ABC transporter permease [Undibacterium macrobrachii]|jgi:putative ABC transport system permease protein|uniref:ABC transporter permease n=1 Tax=Undibacterium macrobrachii TaxID=1119058 RepID=A0ABQ2XLT0_9BURK|nr:FtsX-like permease family protein [Undibacterium macrobrachii]GGX23995.1 ABC transporter permease [Undibacterium macrobrachii]
MKTFFSLRPISSALMRNKLGPVLVALQVALSLAILVNAIYIVNLRLEVAARPSGIADEQEVFRVNIRNQILGGHEDQVALQKREAETIRAVPGVVSVARVNSIPVSRSGSNTSLAVDRKQDVPTAVTGMFVSPDSLVKAWKLRLIEGQDFQASDFGEIDPNVSRDFVKKVIVSKALAQKLFPGQSRFVGREFFFGTGSNANAVTIIGVVETLQTSGAQATQNGEFATLLPARITGQIWDGYSVRAESGQRDRVMKEVEEALRKASATPVYVKASSMEKFRDDRYRSEKGLAWMLLAVSSLLVVVTASGIVGMSTLWVAQRRKQIGIRRALGARRIDILTYFIAENWLITTGGIVFGIALAIGLNQVLVGQFELPKLPVSYLVLSPLVFWILGVIAVYAPAWRAASISPATATRGV